MKDFLPQNLIALAEALPAPLYLVGGATRDFLARLSPKSYDYDLASPLPVEEVIKAAKNTGFHVVGVYKNTGTVKLKDQTGGEYEFTRFRHDKYIRGVHTPCEIQFTDDIEIDARRRDFTCNAVYYDVKNARFVDPLQGIPDVKNKCIRTVDKAEKVFGEDGLRLMRLARLTGQLGFLPTKECLAGAKAHAELILDITKERVFTELRLLLCADDKYGNPSGHYEGLQILERIGVLDLLLPELTAGRGQAQRKDFHKYDVLEHSLRVVKYAPKDIRLAALLHDVGKPFCLQRDGNTFSHPQEGERIANDILKRLGAPNKEREQTAALVALHMYDYNCQTSEEKVRKFFVDHYSLLPQILALKQADYSGCMDDLSVAPTVKKWQGILQKMQAEEAPLTLKQLAVNGNDFLTAGVEAKKVGIALQRALRYAACQPQENTKERLLKLLPVFLF